MKKGIQETDKSFVFYREIGGRPVTVTLRCGWIGIEEIEPKPGWLTPFRKTKILRTFTTEDAKNLVAAIQELVPKSEEDECKKSPNG